MSEDTLKNAIEGAKRFAKKPGANPAEAAAALDVREGMTLQLLKICYAHGLITRGQNGQYRLEKSGEVLAWLRGEKIEV